MERSRFGPFALEERLGDHSTSTVFRGLHVQQRRPVAMKVFSAPLIATSPAAKGALIREMDTLKSLLHPNIARCFGGLLEDSQGCIVWELAEGETLASLLARRERLSWETVVEYGAQISSALEVAHAAGVVHQDLTPDKIMVGPNDQLKVLDFRADRATNPTCLSSQRRTAERIPYWSPEQLRNDKTVTHRSDLFSLGCLMYQMLVGAPPFPGPGVAELQRQHGERPARLDSLVFDCPVWLDSLVGQLLDPDPLRRPYSAQAVTLALQETQRKVAAQTSVLEHAAGGFSTIQRTADQNIARDLLQKARREVQQKKRSNEEQPPFWEQPWFLAACLVALLMVVGGYVFWPASEESLFQNAQLLMASPDEMQWERARQRYLEPLLEKFPQGKHADEARAFIDQIDMARAEKRLKLNQKFHRPPSTEGEQLYAEAVNFEQFGDRFTALEKYESMILLLKDQPADRPYMNLALRQKAKIEQSGGADNRAAFIEEQLKRADQLEADGKVIDAREIWKSILKLYGDKREFAALASRADEKLEGKPRAEREDSRQPEA